MSENPHDKSGLERRITERLLDLGLSPRAASVQAGGGPDLIRNIIRGRSQAPRAESLVRLASVLQVSLDYLMTGTGNAEKITSNNFGAKLKVSLLSWVSAGRMAFPDVSEETIGMIEETDLSPDGDWIALQVVGDSMDRISPPDSIIFIDRRDKVLVPNACYVIANGDGEATYKRFRTNPMRFEPVSTNPSHETIYPQREPLIVGRVKKSILKM
jgi:SOS-response transcriptional repressor LexA